MPAIALRCRICETGVRPRGGRHLLPCFGPLEPAYDRDELVRTATRERIEAGPRSLWRYAALLPVAPPPEQRLAARLDAARRRAPARRGLRRRRALAQAGHRQPHALLQGSRRRRGRGEGAGARPGHARLLLDRKPRQGRRSAGSGGGARSCRLLPGRPRAREARRHGGVRGDHLRRRRHLRRLQPPHGRALLRARLGLRQCRPALVLRRGLEDLAYEIAEQLGWKAPDAVVGAHCLGGSLLQGRPGIRASCVDLGLVEGGPPRLYGGQAEGCSPVAAAFAEGRRGDARAPATVARSLAIGNPADGDRAVAAARDSGGAIYAVAEEDVGANMALLAESTGVFGETAAGVTLGALREAAERGAARPGRPRRPARDGGRPQDTGAGRGALPAGRDRG